MSKKPYPPIEFRDKADKALDALWDSGELNQEKLDRLRCMHIRDILSDRDI